MITIPLCGTAAREEAPNQAVDREQRRLALLRSKGLFQPNLTGATIARAITLEDRAEALKLVHDVFVERGYILASPTGLRLRCFDALPETGTFVAKVGGQVVAADGLVVDCDGLGLPADGVFRREIDALRADNRRIVEATNKAVRPTWRRTPVPTELARCCFAYALAVGADDLVAEVGPSHTAFYEMHGFERISPARNYSADTVDPVVLIRLDLRTYVDRLTARPHGQAVLSYHVWDNPYHADQARWAEAAEGFFAEVEALRELFVTRSGLLGSCRAHELAAIRRRWGEATFARVLSADAPATTRR